MDASVSALDEVAPTIAAATLAAARGLAAGLDPGDPVEAARLRAQARLVAHLESAAGTGDSGDGALGSAGLGADGLALLLGSAEATDVDLAAMSARADVERDRLRALLERRLRAAAPGGRSPELVAELQRDHPDADGVLAEAQALTDEVIAWTAERRLVPYSDGTCVVGPAPESRQWAMAMMAWAAPGEPDTPSWYWVTPPGREWPRAGAARSGCRSSAGPRCRRSPCTRSPPVTSRTASRCGTRRRSRAGCSAATRSSRAGRTTWRRSRIEEGFHADDPRYAIGVAIEALLRVTRLACAIGLHAGGMTVAEAARRFEQDAFLAGPAALSEARRGTFDPTYGRYTWGKLEILRRCASGPASSGAPASTCPASTPRCWTSAPRRWACWTTR